MKAKKAKTPTSLPTVEQLRTELSYERYKKRYKRILKSTLSQLIVVASVVVLIATIWMPVLRIFGTAMTPTLGEGDIVISIKGSEYQTGDLIAFYLGNKVLVRRCIAGPGQWVDIDEDGNVYVDKQKIDEPYLSEKLKGDGDIELPYQVPENRYFCMGDHRATAVDSRYKNFGCVAEDQIVGKIVFRIWPITQFGAFN